ncbi:MAG: hypothetical protein V3W18_04155, partial [candidate division Zixibacteria bacterium]
GTIDITSKRWGPHHGPQANILSGNATYEFAGETYDTDHPHFTSPGSDGCVTCHMASPYGAQAGGHTMSLTYDYHGSERANTAGCESDLCHASMDDLNPNGFQDSIIVRIEALRTLLINDGVIDPADPDYALIPDVGPLTLTLVQAGALYNFQTFREDRSNGIHNPSLALDALDASIAAMGGR